MRSSYSQTLGGFLSVLASVSAHAEADLTGKWTGTFSGVQVEIPLQHGPLGFLSDGQKRVEATPKFLENTLQLEVSTQKNGLVVGTWSAGEFKQKFVCAQTGPAMWNCVDSGGRAYIEVKSANEIKVCYLDNREGAQGAGCGLLRKSP